MCDEDNDSSGDMTLAQVGWPQKDGVTVAALPGHVHASVQKGSASSEFGA